MRINADINTYIHKIATHSLRTAQYKKVWILGIQYKLHSKGNSSFSYTSAASKKLLDALVDVFCMKEDFSLCYLVITLLKLKLYTTN